MVDFNNEGLLSGNHEYLLQLLIIESYYNVVLAKQEFFNKEILGQTARLNVFKSRLISLFSYVKYSLRFNGVDIVKFYEELKACDDFTVLDAKFDFIEEFLYESGLTKFDARKYVSHGEVFQSEDD